MIALPLKIIIIASSIIGIGGIPWARSDQVICPRVINTTDNEVSFGEVERRLICGDQSGVQPYSDEWAYVPPNQAQFHLKAILQRDGYLNPSFEIKDNVLFFDPGPIIHISELKAQGEPAYLDLKRRRKIVGYPLTPSRLDELESWTTAELRRLGYACPQLKTRADRDSGQVLLSIEAGERKKIGDITEESIAGLQRGTLSKYYAFESGDYFNIREISLSERRILEGNAVTSLYFETKCYGPDLVSLHQASLDGPPRMLTLGFGANTEQGILGRASWGHHRLDKNASSVEFELMAGLKTQRFKADLYWYYLDMPSSHYLRPAFDLVRESADAFESLSAKANLYAGYVWDAGYAQWRAELGPAYRLDRTIVGLGPDDARSLQIEALLDVVNHDFEYFRADPQHGYRVGFRTAFADRSLLSPYDVSQFQLNGEALHNYKRYDPPLWIFGVRWGFATTATDVPLDANIQLPTTFRYFLGGTTDLRGFGRKSLPRSLEGALTSAFIGVEVRYADLPYGIQPFVFADGGQMGLSSWSLNYPIYHSPGLGIRWKSPIGVFRGTLARGYEINEGQGVLANAHPLQFYFAYGEEF